MPYIREYLSSPKSKDQFGKHNGFSSKLLNYCLKIYNIEYKDMCTGNKKNDSKIHSLKSMREELLGKIGMSGISEICCMTQGKENDHRKEELYQLTFDENDRVAFNALHALSHFDLTNNEWLYSKHDDLIERVMKEKHIGKCRLMLKLLLRQPFEEDSLRSDFIDFCMDKITACAQPYAIRAYCIKLAYEHMKYYPELLEELKRTLNMLEQEALSPGLLSAKRQIMKKICS